MCRHVLNGLKAIFDAQLCAALAREIPKARSTLADVTGRRGGTCMNEIFRKMWQQIGDPDVAVLIDAGRTPRAVRFTLLQRHIMVAWLEGAIRSDSTGHCVLHSLVTRACSARYSAPEQPAQVAPDESFHQQRTDHAARALRLDRAAPWHDELYCTGPQICKPTRSSRSGS
jgi:hypothetical protein